MSTLTQLLLLIFALDKTRTRRDQHKALAAIVKFQFHEMPVPIFCQISMSPPQNTLFEMLILLTREARESPSGDLDPLNSLINFRISTYCRDIFHLEAASFFNKCHRRKMCSA
jgi:hypothetical protein